MERLTGLPKVRTQGAGKDLMPQLLYHKCSTPRSSFPHGGKWRSHLDLWGEEPAGKQPMGTELVMCPLLNGGPNGFP